LTIEIQTILQNGLDRIIQATGLERMAYRFYDVLGDVLKRVDFEKYGFFRAIMLKEGTEWEAPFAETSQEDQIAAKDVAKQFFEVMSSEFELICRCSKTTSPQRKKWTKFPGR
jgi:hypothetical protein